MENGFKIPEENEEKLKLTDLDIQDHWKHALALCIKGASIKRVAARIDRSYTSVAQQLGIYQEKGWLIPKHMGTAVVYILNQERIEV